MNAEVYSWPGKLSPEKRSVSVGTLARAPAYRNEKLDVEGESVLQNQDFVDVVDDRFDAVSAAFERGCFVERFDFL